MARKFVLVINSGGGCRHQRCDPVSLLTRCGAYLPRNSLKNNWPKLDCAHDSKKRIAYRVAATKVGHQVDSAEMGDRDLRRDGRII